MHRVDQILSLLFLLGALTTLSACADERPEPPSAQEGVLDLRHWNFDRDGPVALQGEWQFWWKELLPPNKFLGTLTPPQPQGTFSIPKAWVGQDHPTQPDISLGSTGYATFRIQVLLAPDAPTNPTGIAVKFTNSAHQLWVLNETQAYSILRNGIPSQNPTNEIPERVPQISPLPTHATTLTFIWQVSNAQHYFGGVPYAPVMGVYQELTQELLTNRLQETALLGFLLIMSVYNFLLFYLRSKDSTSLWLGLATLAFSVRLLTLQKFPGIFLDPSPQNYLWLVRCEFIALIVACGSLVKFLALISSSPLARKTAQIYLICVGGFILFTLTTEALTHTRHMQTFIFLSCMAFIPIFTILFKESTQGSTPARMCIIGFSPILAVLLIAIVELINNPNQLPVVTKFGPYAMGFVLLVQSYTLTLRFSQALETAELLTYELGAQVEKQTEALKQNNEALAQAYSDLQNTSKRELSHAKNLLIQNEKLSQLGQLIASIGHEIANPLMLASLSVDNNREAIKKLEAQTMALFPDDPNAQEVAQIFQRSFDEIHQVNQTTKTATNKIKELSNALRTQSRKEDGITEGIDLNDVSREAMALVSGRIKPHTLTDALGTVPPVSCYRSRIGQVVTNILSNAADALHEKQARKREEGDRSFRGCIHIASEVHQQSGQEGVLIAIADNGDGVPESLKTQIFEQFFTTKPAGVGTGLGLAMCIDIVKDHGGSLEVTDDPKLGGARFELWLPTTVPSETENQA